MPTVSTVLSGIASFGVLAGVLTGVCYLLMSGLRWAGLLKASVAPPRRAGDDSSAPSDSCARCGRRLWPLPGPCRRLRCAHCLLPVCQHCCARASNTRWLCNSCRKLRDVRLQSGEWFHQQLRRSFRSTVASLGNTEKNNGEVQELMEKLVETIIGGGLDEITLCPLSHQPEYTNFCALYKDPLIHILRRLYASLRMALSDSAPQDGEATSDLHSELKILLKQIIQDAMKQPQLKDGNGLDNWTAQDDNTPACLDKKSYEDILATAILNKIFAKYQQNRFRGKRSTRSNEKTFDKNSNLLSSDKFTETMQDDLPRSESDSDSVSNSLDDGSWSESSHVEPLSVTIEECIEEVTTRYSTDDETEPKSDMERFLSNLKYIKRQRAPFPELGKDIVDGDITSSDGDGDLDEADKIPDKDELSAGVELLNPVDSWEENWLFQRRRLKTGMGTCQPVPVPMLVPNPTEDYRAMIGDVDADEMSDLSDCSDSVLEDLLDGPDDKKYFESQQEESDEEKPIEVIDKQREIFLQYISEDLSKLIEPRLEQRGLSPDTGQSEATKSDNVQESQVTPAVELTAKDQSSGSPEETDSSHSYSIAETRNLNLPVVHIDSGEGSLDMQQDSEYTVAYATVAQVRPSSQEPSPAPSSAPSPIPKPRTVQSNLTPHEESVEDKSDEDRNSLPELSQPPKPGTIAEREHQKWEKAPPLANNPYSKENIARRHRQRMYLSRHSSSENSIEFPELTATKEPSLMEIDIKHRRDDFNKYVRDYYVNVSEDKALEGHQPQIQVRPSSAEPCLVQTNTYPSQQQQVSVKVEVEVALSKLMQCPGVPTSTHKKTQCHQVPKISTSDDDYISLPSVKELAKQFSGPNEKIPSPTVPIRKQTDLRLHSPVRQVHSLTARNISREVREKLKSVPVPVVKVTSDSSGHVSEDSGTVSPTPCPPPRKIKLQDDIQFWEQLRQPR